MMKNLFFLFFSVFIISCQDSKVTGEVSEPAVESKQFNSDTVSTSVKRSGITVPDDVDDNFETFLNYFNEDSTFQASRIEFPLKGKVADYAKDYEFSEVIIQPREFRKLDFTYDPSSANREVDSYEQKLNVKGNEAVIEIRGIENGIMADYFFEKRKGKWVLVTWEDSST
jgi:hypothetical protein